MSLMLRLCCVSCFAATLGFGATLSGWLLDARCYASIADNRSQDGLGGAFDGNMEIRYCSPNRHTTKFTVVQDDWSVFKFDPVGNEKAIALGLNASHKYAYFVKVTGNAGGGGSPYIQGSRVAVKSLAVCAKVDRHGKHAPGL